MKKLILTCALLTTVSALSFGQSAVSTSASKSATAAPAQQSNAHQMQPAQIAERRAKAYQKQLALNEDQYKKVYDIESRNAQMQMAAKNMDEGNAKAVMMQANSSKDQEMKNVLTAEQYTKYEATKPRTSAPAAPASSNQAAKH